MGKAVKIVKFYCVVRPGKVANSSGWESHQGNA